MAGGVVGNGGKCWGANVNSWVKGYRDIDRWGGWIWREFANLNTLQKLRVVELGKQFLKL